ncbi:MAG: hypothetical protein IPI64_11895 [Chloracidobacterium sp.]|nr:hypothetical protein [Chloracidobacterium sp.]
MIRNANFTDLTRLDEFTALTRHDNAFPVVGWADYISPLPKLRKGMQYALLTSDQDEFEGFDYNPQFKRVPVNEFFDEASHRIATPFNGRTLFNVDIDFFFRTGGSRAYSDEYIRKLADLILPSLETDTTVLTVALSPELCGGYAPAERICAKLLDLLGIDHPF